MDDERKNAPAGNSPAGTSRPNPVTGCPLTAALTVFGGKWKLIIIYWLAEAPAHFAGLRRLIPGISAKVLTEQLRELIADGIIVREPSADIPDPVIYSLTEYGTSLLPIVEAARSWGNGHLHRRPAPPGCGSRSPAPAAPQSSVIEPVLARPTLSPPSRERGAGSGKARTSADRWPTDAPHHPKPRDPL